MLKSPKSAFLSLGVFCAFARNAAAQGDQVMLVQSPPELRIVFMLITCGMCLLAAFMEIRERRRKTSKESRVSFLARSSALVLMGVMYFGGAVLVFVNNFLA